MKKGKGGRKGKYHEWITTIGLTKLQGWARDGLTDDQIAHNMGVASSTLYDWKNKYPEIAESLKEGKEVIDRHVENALLKRALGYAYEEVTRERRTDPNTGEKIMVVTKRVTKEVQPDTTAQIFWLKNRKPTEWRDRHEMDVKSEVVNRHEYHIEQTITSDQEAAEALKTLFKRQAAGAIDPTVGDTSET